MVLYLDDCGLPQNRTDIGELCFRAIPSGLQGVRRSSRRKRVENRGSVCVARFVQRRDA